MQGLPGVNDFKIVSNPKPYFVPEEPKPFLSIFHPVDSVVDRVSGGEHSVHELIFIEGRPSLWCPLDPASTDRSNLSKVVANGLSIILSLKRAAGRWMIVRYDPILKSLPLLVGETHRVVISAAPNQLLPSSAVTHRNLERQPGDQRLHIRSSYRRLQHL